MYQWDHIGLLSKLFKSQKAKVAINRSFSSTIFFIHISHSREHIRADIFLIYSYINDLYSAYEPNFTSLVRSVNSELKKIARWFRTNKMVIKYQKGYTYTIFHAKGNTIWNYFMMTMSQTNMTLIIKEIDSIYTHHHQWWAKFRQSDLPIMIR